MTKKNITTVKYLKNLVKKKQIEDKQQRNKNRRGLTIQQPPIELEEFMTVAAILKQVSGINKDCIR